MLCPPPLSLSACVHTCNRTKTEHPVAVDIYVCVCVCVRTCVHAHIKHSVHDKVLLADLGHAEVHAVNTQSEAKFDSQSLAS